MFSRKKVLFIVTTLALLVVAVSIGACKPRPLPEAGPLPEVECVPGGPQVLLPYFSYLVKPSETDHGKQCSEGEEGAIGCDGYTFPDQSKPWYDAPNDSHILYVNPAYRTTGGLLIFFSGGNGKPSDPDSDDECKGDHCKLYEFAAQRGYHVIGLSYFTRVDKDGPGQDGVQVHNVDGECADQDPTCMGQFMDEVWDGSSDCGSICGPYLTTSEHPQDSIERRLESVLVWAKETHPCDGWGRYLKGDGHVDWTKVTAAGFSLGSGYAALAGLKHPEIRRVAILAGPNDGRGDSSSRVAAPWMYVGAAASRYYGLVHYKNKMDSETANSELYKVYAAWEALGMGSPFWGRVSFFDPAPGHTNDFGGLRMLVSKDECTTAPEAHVSVVRDQYNEYKKNGLKSWDVGELHCSCTTDDCRIGYEDAWGYILGTGY